MRTQKNKIILLIQSSRQLTRIITHPPNNFLIDTCHLAFNDMPSLFALKQTIALLKFDHQNNQTHRSCHKISWS